MVTLRSLGTKGYRRRYPQMARQTGLVAGGCGACPQPGAQHQTAGHTRRMPAAWCTPPDRRADPAHARSLVHLARPGPGRGGPGRRQAAAT
jgi:hypothetical protein